MSRVGIARWSTSTGTVRSRIRYATNTITSATTIATAESIRSEEHTSELQSLAYLVCRLLLEKKKKKRKKTNVVKLNKTKNRHKHEQHRRESHQCTSQN